MVSPLRLYCSIVTVVLQKVRGLQSCDLCLFIFISRFRSLAGIESTTLSLNLLCYLCDTQTSSTVVSNGIVPWSLFSFVTLKVLRESWVVRCRVRSQGDHSGGKHSK